MHSELFEIGISKFDVVDLGGFFSKLKDVIVSGFHVLDITPAGVQIVGALILAFDGDE